MEKPGFTTSQIVANLKDGAFVPVTIVGATPMTPVTNPTELVKTLSELLALAPSDNLGNCQCGDWTSPSRSS